MWIRDTQAVFIKMSCSINAKDMTPDALIESITKEFESNIWLCTKPLICDGTINNQMDAYLIVLWLMFSIAQFLKHNLDFLLTFFEKRCPYGLPFWTLTIKLF